MSITEARAQAIAWIERLESDAHWARTPAIRDEAIGQASVLRTLLAALPETPTTDDAGESQHDHAGEPRLWCETHQHTHIATVPRFTYLCKDCGWGQWYGAQAREHQAWALENLGVAHTTYEVEHVMHPLPSPPTEEQWEYGAIWEGPTGKRWYAMEGDAFDILEAAEREVERYGDPQIVLGRRRKAGPWEPVEAAARVGGEPDAG